MECQRSINPKILTTMKFQLIDPKILMVLCTLFIFNSCNKEETSPTQEVNMDLMLTQTQEAADADISTESVFSLMDIAFSEVEENGGRGLSLFPECVTITIHFENGTTFVTLDFGTGCELRNGAIVSGKIHLRYGPPVSGTFTILYDFENFTYNTKGIEGEGSIFRERNNANGNPQSTGHHNLTIHFPQGPVAHLVGTKTREWIEGYGSGVWRDNVFLVTGNRTVTFLNGFEQNAIVTTPLRREAICPFFVSGIIAITRNGHEATLNFGDGECDNIAILTVNGIDHEIILHR